ncbi:MAG: bifunctional phosphoribosylaminoimidazolecarboxamide formyltransferase/IMP cyclohydrolase [Flavobacteriales bacterium]
MSTIKQAKTALISVFHKDNLGPIVQKMHDLGIELYSTGGTQSFIEGLEIPVNRVEDVTGYPSILGGRVKTLHPNVFGGILWRRGLEDDIKDMDTHSIPTFDIVIVDLYPFEDTVASGAEESAIIEKIDIGGISLIRAAAKNHKDVVIIPSRDEYSTFLDILEEGNGETTLEQRKRFAAKAFQISSHYDTHIYNYFNLDTNFSEFKQSYTQFEELRYGENPHQKGTFHGDLSEIFDQVHGRAISYNNLLDIDAATNLIGEFSETTFAVLKHNNACGIASRENVLTAWKDALAGDPISAFGGVLVTNAEVDLATAEEINKIFFEVIIAPSYSADALEVLKGKKNRIILVQKAGLPERKVFRTVLNGVLEQDANTVTDSKENFQLSTTKAPTEAEKSDLEFASKICKHTKSNAIIFAKNKQMLSSGVGQTSRVDALKQAVIKAKTFGFELEGSVMASDAFFPFPDCVELADEQGIKAVVQPGGSIKDQLSIDYCNDNEMAMVFTGTRHFKH